VALTVTEANAVFDLLHWIGGHQVAPNGELVDTRCPVTPAEAADALALLGEHAGARLQVTVRPAEARQAVQRLAGRLAGADSDGAAQAVCRGIATHLAHNGSLPWPSIRRPYDEWVAAHDAAAEPPVPRVELDGQTSIEDHL